MPPQSLRASWRACWSALERAAVQEEPLPQTVGVERGVPGGHGAGIQMASAGAGEERYTAPTTMPAMADALKSKKTNFFMA